MEYLPGSFFQQQQQPVVFFAAGPPTQTFRNEQGPPGYHCRTNLRENSGNNMSLAFLAKLAFFILSLYAMSMAVRVLLYLFAIVFSPPVLLLCLFTLVLSSHHGWDFSTRNFNAREFQRCVGNPCLFRRYFPWGPAPTERSGPPRRSRESANINHHPNATASGTTRPPATRDNKEQRPATSTTSQRPRSNSPSHDFELVNPFHLMMAVAGTDANTSTDNEARNTTPATSNASEQDPSEGNNIKPEFTKIPVHRLETEQALVVSMDISGFDPSQLHITVENTTTLCIRGERTNKIGDRFVLEENFDLDPTVFELDNVTADACDGVLQVKVDKKAPSQPRVISINANSDKTD
jgi:HSP20 family molecular chaperone IbpA